MPSLCLLSTLLFAAPPMGDPLERKTLQCGVRLAVLTVPDASIETFFALLPIGMGADDAGCTQWAHLLEHMVIRTTDAEAMTDGEIEFNGETGDATLRLDVHAPPALAPMAAAKLIAWLGADHFDAAILEREKKKIAGELATTTPAGYTHKWATAAWAQAIRHGATDIAVQGAVDQATTEAVADYAERKLKLGANVALYAAGPLPLDEVARLFDGPLASGGGLDALANALGANPDTKPTPAPVAPPLLRGDRQVMWDVARHHVIEWYSVPDAKPGDRVAAILLVQTLTQTLLSDPVLQKAKVVAMVSADVVVDEGRVVQFTASLPDAASASLAREAFARARERLTRAPPSGSLDRYLVAVRAEFGGGLPDFRKLRGQWAGRPQQRLVEAQLLLGLATRERSLRLTLPEMGRAAEALTGAALKELRDVFLAPERASALLLVPKS